MRYYLRTLEGIGGCLGSALYDEFVQVFVNYDNTGIGKKLAAFRALKQLRATYPNSDFTEIYNIVDGKYYNKPSEYLNVWQGVHEFLKADSRSRQNIKAQEQASAQAAAIAKAREEEAESAYTNYNESIRQVQEEEAATQAAAVIAEYEALREEISENIEYIDNGQIVLTTPEQMRIYKELTGREYSEILERDEEAAETYESEVKRMEEENKTIEISPVVVSSEHEYTIIDEDANSITYQDETGEIYIEPKGGKAWPWILAGAVAVFFLV